LRRIHIESFSTAKAANALSKISDTEEWCLLTVSADENTTLPDRKTKC
jgi:hypothetical protein